MTQEVTNFARFYALFNKLPYSMNKEDLKKEIVLQYTWNRTDSLREMTAEEYNACCDGLEKLAGQKDLLRKKRSLCLKLMQKLGIDTSDWARINNFCEHPRIAGKPFARITVDELDGLATKLRAIQRNGGLKARKETENMKRPAAVACIYIDPAAPKC